MLLNTKIVEEVVTGMPQHLQLPRSIRPTMVNWGPSMFVHTYEFKGVGKGYQLSEKEYHSKYFKPRMARMGIQ